MSSIYIPSFSEISAVARGRGADSQAPGLWRGLVGAWPLQEVGGLTAFDVSGYRNNGTLTSMDAATDHVVTQMGRALDFAAKVNAYVTAPVVLSLSLPITIACWFNQTATNAWGILASVDKTTGSGILTVDARNDGKLCAYSVADNGISWRVAASVKSYLANQWQHAVGVFASATSRSIYFNGAFEATNTDSSNVTNLNHVSINAYYAYWYSDHWIESGGSVKVTGVLVYNRALLPSEIRSLYTDPWAMYRLRRRVQVRGAEVGTTIRWPWQLRRHRRMAGAR